MIRLKMKKYRHDLGREAVKISALSSGKINKYKEILPFIWRKLIELAQFIYSPLGKAFQKHTEKQVDAIGN